MEGREDKTGKRGPTSAPSQSRRTNRAKRGKVMGKGASQLTARLTQGFAQADGHEERREGRIARARCKVPEDKAQRHTRMIDVIPTPRCITVRCLWYRHWHLCRRPRLDIHSPLAQAGITSRPVMQGVLASQESPHTGVTPSHALCKSTTPARLIRKCRGANSTCTK